MSGDEEINRPVSSPRKVPVRNGVAWVSDCGGVVADAKSARVGWTQALIRMFVF